MPGLGITVCRPGVDDKLCLDWYYSLSVRINCVKTSDWSNRKMSVIRNFCNSVVMQWVDPELLRCQRWVPK